MYNFDHTVCDKGFLASLASSLNIARLDHHI